MSPRIEAGTLELPLISLYFATLSSLCWYNLHSRIWAVIYKMGVLFCICGIGIKKAYAPDKNWLLSSAKFVNSQMALGYPAKWS